MTLIQAQPMYTRRAELFRPKWILVPALIASLLAVPASAQLTGEGSQFWHQDSPDILGMNERNDFFGSSGVSGDFNNDGYPDLAVGVSHEDIGDILDAGTVHVLYSGPSGLTAEGNQVWSQNTPGIQGDPQEREDFGSSLASGDFNGDGYGDLAIAVPFERVDGNHPSMGAVNVIYGRPGGLGTDGNQLFTQDTPGLEDESEAGDCFGCSLATGDFNQDGFDDLAVGVPSESLTQDMMGAVNVIYGSATGLAVEGNQFWHQDSTNIEGTGEEQDRFGESLTTGDFNNDGYSDLAVGAPGTTGVQRAGAVNVIYGSGIGLTADGNQIWTQGADGLLDTAEPLDFFGWRLTCGDFNGDGFDDLAISADFESVGEVAEAGQVSVIYGAAGGLSAIGNQIWNQDSEGIDEVAEVEDAFGTGSLVAGDFDNDGFDDLAVGSPFEDIEGMGGIVANAGIVNVIYGRPEGLTATGNQALTEESPGTDNLAGRSLVAADFDLDGFDDLAIGAPHAAIGEVPIAGEVTVLRGGPPTSLHEDLERQLRALMALQQLLSLIALLP